MTSITINKNIETSRVEVKSNETSRVEIKSNKNIETPGVEVRSKKDNLGFDFYDRKPIKKIRKR